VLESSVRYDLDFNYGFGVVEVQKGFSSKKLEELVSKDYETLKEKWGIPKDKNFKVIVEQQGAEPYSINEEGTVAGASSKNTSP